MQEFLLADVDLPCTYTHDFKPSLCNTKQHFYFMTREPGKGAADGFGTPSLL